MRKRLDKVKLEDQFRRSNKNSRELTWRRYSKSQENFLKLKNASFHYERTYTYYSAHNMKTDISL